MKKVFAVDEATAPRMLYILRNVLLALVEQPHATLLDVPRMLVDDTFRRHVIGNLSDELVREFWRSEFAGWHDRYRTEAVAPIQNKIGQFLTSPLLRQVVDQMSPELSATVFGDVGSLCVMQVGRRDAEQLADELGGDVQPEDLIAMPKYTAVVRMLIDGEPTRPFTIRTLPPPPISPRHATVEKLLRVSRQRHALGSAA
jgi:hypothetical protein